MARPPRPPRFDRGPRWRARQRSQRWSWLRWAGPLLLIALAWHAWNQPALRAAIGLPLPVPQQVTTRFVLCAAPGHASHCVVDGDTLVIGQRRIRVAGIDAPEIHGACPAESAAAHHAALAMQAWLNAGPFLLEDAATVPHDQHGRELQRPAREHGEALAPHMVRTGHAREYQSGRRQPWC